VVGKHEGVGAAGILEQFFDVVGFGDIGPGFGGDGLAEFVGSEVGGENKFAVDVVFDFGSSDANADSMPLAGSGAEGERRCGKQIESAGGAGGRNFCIADAFIVEQLEFETEGLGHIRVVAAGIGVGACTEDEILDSGVGTGREIPVKGEVEITEDGFGREVSAGSMGMVQRVAPPSMGQEAGEMPGRFWVCQSWGLSNWGRRSKGAACDTRSA
jgi:hypothetical protein